MNIFYAPDILETGMLPDDEAGHCVRVLRQTVGDEILLTDGKGAFYCARIIDAHPKHCKVEIISTNHQTPLWDRKIEIAVAPTKNMDRMEWFVEKATEIGVDRITPILCRHSERKVLKVDRLEKIAVSAMKQSEKATLPILDQLTPFRQVVERLFEGQKFIAHCSDHVERKELKDCMIPGESALVLIGPEGDFSEEEVTMAMKAGFVPVSLGRSRLRTETAALVACHTLHF